MESNDKLKEIDIKNCASYYFNDIIKIEDFNVDSFLMNESLYENILIYNISYNNLIGAKPLRIRFDKATGFTRVYDGTRYLVFLEVQNIISFRTRLAIL